MGRKWPKCSHEFFGDFQHGKKFAVFNFSAASLDWEIVFETNLFGKDKVLQSATIFFFAVMGFQHLFDNFRDIYWRKVSISNLREYLVLHRARLNIFSQNLKSVKKLSLAGAGCQLFGGKIWNTRWMPGNFRELPVFRWRSYIPKLKIPFPSEVLVSSDYRPYRNMAFYNVLAGQRSSFRNRARLNFQALRWWKKKAVTWAKKLSNRFGFC